MSRQQQKRARQTPAALLGAVAAALDACERAGLTVRLRHGIVETRHGYVLPVKDGWVARTRNWSPFTPAEEGDDD